MLPVDDALKALAAVVCPKCGNSSEVDHTIPSRDRPKSLRAGIYAFYTERAYYDVRGDFRGRVVIDEDDMERYDAPDSRWTYDCIHCHHEWPMPEQVGVYEVRKTLDLEARVALMSASHRKTRLLPADLRAGDVFDTGDLRLLRVMASPEPNWVDGQVRVPYYVLDGDPRTLPDRRAAEAAIFPYLQEYDVYRPIGPPECVSADLIAEIAELVPRAAARPRLRVKMVMLELREHFTAESVQRFMDGVLERSEREWWVLDNPARGAARAIDL